MHCVGGNSSIFSITEWADFYTKFKTLLAISLFKNFRNAKLFELWRRFLKKTNKTLYLEKLKKKFHHIDQSLLNGLMEIKEILKEMSNVNIFALDAKEAMTINKFQEIHKGQLKDLDKKLNVFRERVKQETTKACDESYQTYKELKRITLEETVSKPDKGSNSDKAVMPSIVKAKKQEDDSNFAQNFLKDAMPYAQDATRR